MVGLVPDRARLHPGRAYPSGRPPPGKAVFVPRRVEALGRAGVEAVDLTGVLEALRADAREPFDADDHHWTSSGAAQAGQVLAGAARSHLVPPPEPALPLFDLRWDPNAPSPSSLIRKLGFRPGSRLERIFRVSEPRLLLERLPDAAEPAWPGRCASYWTTSYGDLGSPQVFANALGCPVRIRLVRGGGSDPGPAGEIRSIRAQRPDLRGHVFVWEIPEYHLVAPPGRPLGFVQIPAALDAS